MRGILTALGLAFTLTLAAPAAAQINPAYDYDTADIEINENAFPITLGFSFSLSQATTINALGFWIPANVSSNRIAIWDLDGNELVSTTVDITDAVTRGDYRYRSIAPFNLAQGEYVIGGELQGGGFFPLFLTGVTTAPGYTWTGHRENINPGFNFPQPEVGLGEQSAALVNFSISAVPEPATWAMMLIGFGAVGVTLRRRKSAARVRFA